MTYKREEQETLYSYEPSEGYWRVYSTYPVHIRKLLEYADIERTEIDENGDVIMAQGHVQTNQIRLFRPRL